MFASLCAIKKPFLLHFSFVVILQTAILQGQLNQLCFQIRAKVVFLTKNHSKLNLSIFLPNPNYFELLPK